MPPEEDALSSQRMWKELRVITALFLVAQLLYAYFIEHSIAGEALRELPDLLKPSKQQILRTIFYVFLVSWPLAISAGFIAFQDARSDLNIGIIPFAIVAPFLFQAWLVDNRTVDVSGSTHGLVFSVLTFYFWHYKPPLFIASVLYGIWTGRKLGQLSVRNASKKGSSL